MADEFSEPVKRVLATRVGNVCSNPGCRALTSGPQENPAKALNIGVAAHITAASAGGPRYDPRLVPEERSGPSNGIWLCQNCAKLVDNDPARFTIELLKRWKSSAESEARDRVGKTATGNASPSFGLKLNDRIRIAPIIPRSAETVEWLIIGEPDGSFLFRKSDSDAQVEIPVSFIEQVHRFSGTAAGLVQLQPVLTKQAMFKLFNIPDRGLTIIGQVSSLLSYKGHLVLLDAARRVLDRHPECFFLMVVYERREEGYRESLLRRAAVLGIADRVRIAGYPGPIGDVWNIIDIHVHASHLDSLPNALLEPLAIA